MGKARDRSHNKKVEEKILTSFINFDIDGTIEITREALGDGSNPLEMLDALRRGMDEVGQRFQQGTFFLADLVMAGETMKAALEILRPHLQDQKSAAYEKVVLGTILGDLHDIGKDIVRILLISAGFDVHDLGIDVPPLRFVEKAKEVGASVIAVSSLLSTTVPTTEEVVKELRKANLRDKVKVIIGGAAVRPYHVEKYGVDAAVNDAVEGLKIIKSWIHNKEQ